MCEQSSAPPSNVITTLRRGRIRGFEWVRCEDDRWYGYATDYSGMTEKRILITVALVTGKAVVEVFDRAFEFDVLI